MTEETASNDLPAKIPAKAISTQRTFKSRSIGKPLTKRQQEIFDLYELGWKQQAIADKLGIKQCTISHVLSKLASRHAINKDRVKLSVVNVIQSKLNEKLNERSTKDVVDVAIELNKVVNPVKNDVNVIDKQLNLSINDEALNNLPLADKLERIRRALSDGSAN